MAWLPGVVICQLVSSEWVWDGWGGGTNQLHAKPGTETRDDLESNPPSGRAAGSQYRVEAGAYGEEDGAGNGEVDYVSHLLHWTLVRTQTWLQKLERGT